MTRTHFVSALGIAATLAAAPAAAQTIGVTTGARTVAYADDAQSYYDARRGAYDNGYREGLRQGEKDGRDRRAFNYQDERTWKRADNGYNRSFGDIERYRQQFRVGYAQGYEDGYSRYAPVQSRNGRAVPRSTYPNTGYGYPGGYGPPQTRYPDRGYGDSRYGYGYGSNAAFRNGANDGVEKGREDARKHRSYDPLRHSWYRSGDHDYKKDYGPKDLYRNVYRDGFKEGYDRGYREGTYRY
jgi:hypothetical protein